MTALRHATVNRTLYFSPGLHPELPITYPCRTHSLRSATAACESALLDPPRPSPVYDQLQPAMANSFDRQLLAGRTLCLERCVRDIRRIAGSYVKTERLVLSA
eukprot:6204646-Pleurochrysis_carterae.AAC.1